MAHSRTIYDIAKDAGVSPATVSRALSGKGYVSQSTQAKVLAAANGFVPRKHTEDSVSRISPQVIAIVSPHSSNYLFSSNTYRNVLNGISITAKQYNYRLLLDTSFSDTPDAIALYKSRRVDGFILLGAKKNNDLIPALLDENIPFVLVGDCIDSNYGKSFSKVDIDDFTAAQDLTDYLLTLGHQRIAFISNSFEYASSYYRYLGYKSALEEVGYPCSDKYIVSFDNMTEENAINLTKRMLFSSDIPTAIIAFNDIISMAVYQAVSECGYSIPQDISIIGFDDSDFAKYASPPLTTVWQPSLQKGEKAAELLFNALAAHTIPTESITLPSALIYRESCSKSRAI